MLKRIGGILTGFFLVVSIMFSMTGCVALLGAAAGGAGTAYWLSGKLSTELPSAYENTIQASKDALVAMDLEINKVTKSGDITQIRSKYTDGREIWIDIRPINSKSTKVDVRVGLKGDKQASGNIIETIKGYL